MLWSRLGSAYDPAGAAGRARRAASDRVARDRPAAGGHRALPRRDGEWPGVGELRDWQECQRDWVEANNACRADILDRLRADGPLPASELPDTCVEPWQSSGWNNNRNVHDDARPPGAARRGRRGRSVTGGTGCGTWPRGSIRTTRIPRDEARRLRDERRLQRPRHRPAAGRRARSSRSTSARPGSPPWSRACAVSGGSTRASSASRSRAARPCSRRSTGCCTTASG